VDQRQLPELTATIGPALIRRRRHELGLTRRQLARAAAIDLTVIESAEHSGLPIYQQHTVALCWQLGLTITTPASRCQATPADAEILGAILADLQQPMPTQSIAAALDWSVGHVLAAANELRTELNRFGQTVTRGAGHELALAPSAASINDELRAQLHREALRIDDTSAQLLHSIISGRRDDRLASTLTDEQRSIARHLIAAGIITEHHDELQASDALQDALDDRHLRFLRW
jgi:hypothetical protein